MKKNILFLIGLILLLSCSVSPPKATKVFEKDGNVYAQIGNNEPNKITSNGEDTNPQLSKNRDFIIYLRTTPETADQHTEQDVLNDKVTAIMIYNFAEKQEKVLVQGCHVDGKGSSSFSYANSEKFPFDQLCDLSNIFLSPDGKRVYFETTAWATSSAIHYCDIETCKIFFFHSGNINKIESDGSINLLFNYIKDDQGREEKNTIFDENGNKIKTLDSSTETIKIQKNTSIKY